MRSDRMRLGIALLAVLFCGVAFAQDTATLTGTVTDSPGAAISGAPSPDCVTLATQRGGLARALRCAVKIDPELVESISR